MPRTIVAILFLFLLFVTSPVFWLVFLILRIFGKPVSDRAAVACVRFFCRIMKVICGTKLTVKGTENIPKNEAVVFAMNHRGIFDIVLSYPYTKGRTGFIAKQELKKVPIFSTWLWFANCLFLNRTNIREGYKTIMKGIDKVRSGISMCIFPEGTRNRDKEHLTTLLPFHDASFKLATRSNARVIPVAFYNTSECFENHKPVLKSCPVYITFGEPVRISDLPEENQKFIGKYMQGVIQKMLDEQAEAAAADGMKL